MIIGFIGAGAMGGALIEGFIKSGIEYTNIVASVKTMEKKDYLEKNLGIKVYTHTTLSPIKDASIVGKYC